MAEPSLETKREADGTLELRVAGRELGGQRSSRVAGRVGSQLRLAAALDPNRHARGSVWSAPPIGAGTTEWSMMTARMTVRAQPAARPSPDRSSSERGAARGAILVVVGLVVVLRIVLVSTYNGLVGRKEKVDRGVEPDRQPVQAPQRPRPEPRRDGAGRGELREEHAQGRDRGARVGRPRRSSRRTCRPTRSSSPPTSRRSRGSARRSVG